MLSALRQINYVYEIIRNILATFAQSKLFTWTTRFMNNVATLDFQFVFRFRCRLEST